MPARAPHRFTRRDYYQMASAGVIKPGARVELLNGQVFNMSPIGPSHGGAVKRLNGIFTQQSRGRFLVSVQDPVVLDDYSEPEPDIMLLQPSPDFYSSNHPTPAQVHLLIEVADSTLAYDRGEKLAAYGRAAIAEVWIVNIAEEVIEVYREPHFGGYASSEVLPQGSEAHPLAFPDVTVEVSALFRRNASC